MTVYDDLNVVPIINAGGTLTRLGGSVMLPEVTDAMAAASRHFVDMNELHLAAGTRIADLVGAEAAHVCVCAAAGITLMAAACMTGVNKRLVRQLPKVNGLPHRFVVQRPHRNSFDQALEISGGVFVEVDANRDVLACAIDDQTAGVYVTYSWFCTEPVIPLAEVTEIAHKKGVPVIVDAAAEIPPVGNLTRFLEEGADLVIFSGGKVLRGPQASGFILGRADLIEACRLNDAPNMGVGRPMKAGKEEIVGVVKAVEVYVNRDHEADLAMWEGRVNVVIDMLSKVAGVKAFRQLPFGIGQHIPHVAVRWDEAVKGVTYAACVAQLLDGSPRIAVQHIMPNVYGFAKETGSELRIHPHTLQEGEAVIVARRLMGVLGGS